jgi:hypothetical protein
MRTHLDAESPQDRLGVGYRGAMRVPGRLRGILAHMVDYRRISAVIAS